MPAAVQTCHGSQRLVSVKKYSADNKADCPYCTLRLKATRRTERFDLYYEIPAHRPVGTRDPHKIDWANV